MNQIATQPSRPRRSPEQWQQLIEKWQHSGESAKRFCTEHSIGYASFCQWRKRLSGPVPQEPDAAPAFVDLASLASGSIGSWQIVLSLGNGVELKLSQR